MSSYVLRVIEFAGQTYTGCDPDAVVGTFVVECDVDAHDGRGDVAFTSDIVKAKRFPSPVEALLYYQRTSTVRPRRDDGTPNRPLAAFTLECFAVFHEAWS